MEKTMENQLKEAVWICRSLFERGKTSGSTANISFRSGSSVWVSRSGSCFGTITEEDFVGMTPEGVILENKKGYKPSKEWPLHLMFYRKHPNTGAVIHTHGPYSVLFSCLPPRNAASAVPAYTPYLGMRLGRIGWIPYAPPGSAELFRLAEENAGDAAGLILSHHGAVASGGSLMDAFYNMEELEESCRTAWELRSTYAKEIS